MIKEYLANLSRKKIEDYITIDGWLTENEAQALFATAKMLPRNSITVEIGSWQGKSTFCISKGIKSGKVYAIDPFNADAGKDVSSEADYRDRKKEKSLLNIFINNMQRLKVYKKIVIKQGYSYNFNNDFEKIDFLFIDGDHSIEGCKNDYDLYANKVKKGGYIAFHDYYVDRLELGPTYVINEIILKNNDFEFLGQYDSLWVAKKK